MATPQMRIKAKLSAKKLKRVPEIHRSQQTYTEIAAMGNTLFDELLEAVQTCNISALKKKIDLFKVGCNHHMTSDHQRQGLRNIYAYAMVQAAELGFQNCLELLFTECELNINGINRERDTALICATIRGDTKMCTYLLSKGANPNHKNVYGCTALEYAARLGQRDSTVKKATNAKKSKEEIEPEQIVTQGPVSDAMRENYFMITQLLLAKKADPNITNQNGTTPLMWAAQNGHLKIVKALVKAGADLYAEDEQGVIPAISAMLSNKLEILKYLVSLPGFKLNAKTKERGATLLDVAIHANSLAACAVLIRAGAKSVGPSYIQSLTMPDKGVVGIEFLKMLLDAKIVTPQTDLDNKGNSILLAAVTINNVRLVKVLLDLPTTLINKPNTKKATPLIIAVSEGHTEIADILIEKGADYNLAADTGETPLMIALQKHNTAYAHKLITLKNINVNARAPADKNKSALFIAVLSNDLDTVRLLLAAKADTTLTSADITPLMSAALDGNAEMVKLILDATQNKYVNQISTEGAESKIALFWAIKGKNTECVRLLLEAGSQVEARTEGGCTPLMIAAMYGNPEIVQLLLQFGAELEAVSDLGNTAFMYACVLGHVKAAELLKKAGANVNTRNSQQGDALQFAIDQNQAEAIRFLLTPDRVAALQKNEQEQAHMFSYVQTTEVYTLLKSYGLEGLPTLCNTKVFYALLSARPKPELKDYIGAVDLKAYRLELSMGSYYESSYPFFLYSNHSCKETRLLVLQELLKSAFSQSLGSSEIASLVQGINESTIDFTFAREGDLCISLERNGRTYSLSLALKNLPKLLEKSTGSVKDKVWELTEEGLEFIEEEEIKKLKDELYVLFNKGLNQKQKDQIALDKIAEILKQMNAQDKFPTLEALRKLLSDYNTQFVQMSKQLQKVQFYCLQSREAVVKHVNGVKKLIEAYKQEVTEQITNLQSEIVVLQEKQAQRPQTGAGKKGKGKGKHKGKHKGKNKGREKDSLQGSDKSKERFEKGNMVPVFDMPRITREVPKIEPPISPQSAETVQDKDLELQRKAVLAQVSSVATKKQPVFPPIDPALQFKVSSQGNSQAGLGKYLTIPKFTLDSATKIADRLKAQEGRQNFTKVASVLDETAKGHQLLIEVNAALGALAQAFETRKGLNETWPNHVRNVIFHYDEAIRKLHNESDLVKIIQGIHQNFEAISETDLMKAKGQLSLDKIDKQYFLKTINELQIPTFSVERALKMVRETSIEIGSYKESAKLGGDEAFVEKLKRAVGFSLARLCTHLNDMRKFAPYISLDSTLRDYLKGCVKDCLAFGNDFRHFGKNWLTMMDDFVAKLWVKDELGNEMGAGMSGVMSGVMGAGSYNGLRLEDDVDFEIVEELPVATRERKMQPRS